MNEALQKFRAKYPGYDDLSDAELASKLVAKYPEYKDILGNLAPAGLGELPVKSAPFIEQARNQMLGENPLAAATLAGAATAARILPGAVAQMAAPGVGGKVASQMGLSAAGEALGETIEAPITGEGISPGQVALAGMMPAAFRTAGRVVTGIPDVGAAIKRTGQRIIPRMFKAGQESAQDALSGTVKGFADEAAGARAAFQSSGQQGASTLPAKALSDAADDVLSRLSSQPLSTEATARDAIQAVKDRIQSGSITMKEFEALRRHLHALGSDDAGVRAIQKGLYETLEQAAKNNPAAADLQEGLRLFKLGKGGEKLEALVKRHMVAFPGGGPATGEAVNIPRLTQAVNAQRQEFTKLLGDAGMAKLDAVLEQARTVPPKMAWNLVNMTGQTLITASLGGVGSLFGTGGAVAGLLAGAMGKELVQNWVSVTRTPESIKQLVNLTSLGANALMNRPRNE